MYVPKIIVNAREYPGLGIWQCIWHHLSAPVHYTCEAYILATSITKLNKTCFRNMYAPNHICGDIGNVGFFRKVSSECTAKQGILKILINGAISTHVQTPASTLALDPTTFNLRIKRVLYFQTRAKRESYTSIYKAWCLFGKRFSR